MPPLHTGEEFAKAMTDIQYQPVDRTGSYLKLRYIDPNTSEIRNVSIPMGGEIRI